MFGFGLRLGSRGRMRKGGRSETGLEEGASLNGPMHNELRRREVTMRHKSAITPVNDRH